MGGAKNASGAAMMNATAATSATKVAMTAIFPKRNWFIEANNFVIGVYNLVRRHSGLDGQTPAQGAGIAQLLKPVVERRSEPGAYNKQDR